MRIVELTEETRKNILENLLKRSPSSYGKFEQVVNGILEDVKMHGDQAVFDYSQKFDKVILNAQNLRVTEEEIEKAYKQVDKELINVIQKAIANIREYHEKQKRYSWFDSKPNGSILGQKITPIEKVGIYVPGGKAAYPSSVLMNVIPASVAGVNRIVMVTPPGKDGNIVSTTAVAAR